MRFIKDVFFRSSFFKLFSHFKEVLKGKNSKLGIFNLEVYSALIE